MNFNQKHNMVRADRKDIKLVFLSLVLLCSLTLNISVKAQDSAIYSIFLPQVNSLLSPITQSNNPSTMQLLPRIEYGTIGMDYGHKSGSFKPVLEEGVNNSLAFSTEKYRFFKNTTVFGSFRGGRKWDAFSNYVNVNDGYRGTPYLLLDTVGNDNVDRQFYQMAGMVAHTFGRHVVAASIDYQVALAAQTRDPRAKIMVSQINFRPGYLLQLEYFNLGLNLGIDYRSEEINGKTIEENRQDNLYYLLGLRAATMVSDNSFLRTYNRMAYQADAQIANNWLTLMLGAETGKEEVHDGERNWALDKYFSRLEDMSGYVQANLTFKKEFQVHSIAAKGYICSGVGTEIIQKIERIPPFDQEVWVTIDENPSYQQNNVTAELGYTYTKMQSAYLRKFALNGNVRFQRFKNEYRTLTDEMEYQNLIISAGFFRNFKIVEGLFSIAPSIQYLKKLGGNLEITNFDNQENMTLPTYYQKIEDMLVRPDFTYFTTEYWSPKIDFSYERKVNEGGNKIFLKLGAQWIIPEENEITPRKAFRATLGFLL